MPGIPNSSPDYNYKSATLMLMSLSPGERERETEDFARERDKGGREEGVERAFADVIKADLQLGRDTPRVRELRVTRKLRRDA